MPVARTLVNRPELMLYDIRVMSIESVLRADVTPGFAAEVIRIELA